MQQMGLRSAPASGNNPASAPAESSSPPAHPAVAAAPARPAAAAALEDDLLQQMCCLITHEPLRDPVMASDQAGTPSSVLPSKVGGRHALAGK